MLGTVEGQYSAAYLEPNRVVTTIRVHYDSGLGNNISNDVWIYEIERYDVGKRFEFKPMINDNTWSQGNNYIGTGGQTIDVYPNF